MSDEALGAFEEQVLLAVLHARDEAYGMNVRREIEARTDREVSIGAVYATLDRLEAKGLVSSDRVAAEGGWQNSNHGCGDFLVPIEEGRHPGPL